MRNFDWDERAQNPVNKQLNINKGGLMFMFLFLNWKYIR